MTMATLYDLELQESNNFIHALISNGVPPALKLMKEQVVMFEGMGDAGAQLLKELDDENSEMGKGYKRLIAMEKDITEAMRVTEMTVDLAQKANDIFSKNPDSLKNLEDNERSIINDYWLKKKMCIQLLLQKGYTHQELFS
mgnify:CR=1 FL=1